MSFRRFTALAIAVFGWSLGGVGVSVADSGAIALSDDERRYLAERGPIRMCVDPDWEPFERIDENGRHVGMAADLIALVTQRLGIEIELYPTDTWEAALEASQSGACDLMSFLNRTPAREAWLIFTEPLFFDPNVIITRVEHHDIPDPSRLTNETIALPAGTMVAERIQRDFPGLHLIPTESESEAISLVSRGVVDMTVRSLVVAAYTIKQEGLFNLKVAGRIPDYGNALRIGVLKDQVMLRDILDKGVRTLTDAERDVISNRHAGVTIIERVDYRVVWEIVIGALLVIVVLLWLYRRQHQLNRQAAQLAEQRIAQERSAREEQRRLVSMLSHEIKTPLAMIDGAAQTLTHLTRADTPEVIRRIDRIRRATARLGGLTEQLLEKDRLEDDTLTLRRQTVHMDKLIHQLVEEFDPDGGIHLSCDFSSLKTMH